MTVHRDRAFMAKPRGRVYEVACAHLVSDLHGAAGTAELVAAAHALGLPRRYIQHPGTHQEHFDLIGRAAISRADALGIPVLPDGGLARILRAKRTAIEAVQGPLGRGTRPAIE